MIVYKIIVYALAFLCDLCPAWGTKSAFFQEEITLSWIERVDDNRKITQVFFPLPQLPTLFISPQNKKQ